MILIFGLSACAPSSNQNSNNLLSCTASDKDNNSYKYEVKYANGFASVSASINDKTQQVMILESSDYYPAKQVFINLDNVNKYKFQTNFGMIGSNGQLNNEDSDLVVFYNNDKIELKTNCYKY